MFLWQMYPVSSFNSSRNDFSNVVTNKYFKTTFITAVQERNFMNEFRLQKSAGKVLASIFWDQDGILLIDYLPSSSCSWSFRHVSLFLDPPDEVGPSISSSVVLCFFVRLVCILVLVLVVCLCPSFVQPLIKCPFIRRHHSSHPHPPQTVTQFEIKLYKWIYTFFIVTYVCSFCSQCKLVQLHTLKLCGSVCHIYYIITS